MTTEHHLHRIYSKLTPLLPITTETLPLIREALADVALDMVALKWITTNDATNTEAMLSAYWKHFKTAINKEYNDEVLK